MLRDRADIGRVLEDMLGLQGWMDAAAGLRRWFCLFAMLYLRYDSGLVWFAARGVGLTNMV